MNVAREAWVARGGACCILSLKIAAKSVRALTVSFPDAGKGNFWMQVLEGVRHVFGCHF
jgi:hypothetical protein